MNLLAKTKHLLLSFALFVSLVKCDNGDLITSLPNYSGNLNGRQYSGYININSQTGKYLHYWFVKSENNPAKDPLVLWLNGGPGCSSLDGYFYEQGPLHFGKNQTLIDNPWAWTRIANMIFLEAPVGVGFSYSNTPSDYNTNDQQTAQDNYQFLKNFFAKYPTFQNNEFYISGESYAGIYVPTLASLVMKDKAINFQGIAVGNGVTNWDFDGFYPSFLPFAYGHGLLSTITYNQIVEYCENNSTKNKDNCNNAINQLISNMDNIDIYDIYSDCHHQRPVSVGLSAGLLAKKNKKSVGGVPPCIDADKATDYLNTAKVQQAIHVRQDITWSICSDILNYTSTVDSVIPIYQDLIKAKHKILVYSGDVDGAVPYKGTELWINSMNLPVQSLWQEWSIPKKDGQQVAGYITQYQGLTFVTVKGSGHMVPQMKPEAAFYMFETFLLS